MDWSKVNHFGPDEAWGEVEKISPRLIMLLDDFRDEIQIPFHVTFGTQGKHVAPWHGRGLAVDGVVDASGYSKLDLIITAMRYPFHGIGIYPKARHFKCLDPLGFHFDLRYGEAEEIFARRWIAIPDPSPVTLIRQVPLDEANLRKFGIL